MVARRVVQRLPEWPDPPGLLDRDQNRATGVGVQPDLVVVGVVGLERRVPALAVHEDLERRLGQLGGGHFEGGQAVDVVASGQLDPAPERVADHHPERALVGRQRRVELASRRRWAQLGELDAEATPKDAWKASTWEDAFAAYFAEHDTIGSGAPARDGALFQVTTSADRWRVRQVLDDPAGDHEWALVLDVDLAASDEAGAPAIRPVGVERL